MPFAILVLVVNFDIVLSSRAMVKCLDWNPFWPDLLLFMLKNYLQLLGRVVGNLLTKISNCWYIYIFYIYIACKDSSIYKKEIFCKNFFRKSPYM